jgi:hypothetical protein
MKAAKTRALNAKHAGTKKHLGTVKHTPTAQKKAATAHKQAARRSAAVTKAAHLRALGALPCCSAEAVAASLRLAGGPVTDSAVLALHRYAGGSGSAALTIEAALAAACEAGLGGVRPLNFSPVGLDDPAAVILGLDLPEGPHAVTLDPSGAVWSWGALHEMTPEAVVEEAWAVTWP